MAFLRDAYIPESVALVVLGIAVGHFVPGVREAISADVVLFVFVPGLVFDAAFDLDWPVTRGLLPALVGLAVPGVLVSAAIVSVALTLVGMPLPLAFVVGAITAATDPVAVVATLARLRMPHRLRTLIEGESLFNDGTGLVLFAIAVAAATRGLGVAEGAGLFLVTITVSVAAGIAAGFVGAAVLRYARLPPLIFAATLVLAYATFALCAAVGLSGVLGTVVCALTLGNLLRRDWSGGVVARQLDRAWSVVAFALSAVTFLAIGAAIDLTRLGGAILVIATGVIAVVGARALFVYVPFVLARPVAARGWAHVVFWSGLRGAIALAAALSLPATLAQGTGVQEASFGIVLVTLVGQGATAPLVVRAAMRGTRVGD
ncbi:MAG TPA: cation:proton antiporter [Candidatus Acidoferrales bacterium]|nr:cation:proton antiporter [Candidatus Acidoferrales bacterium]